MLGDDRRGSSFDGLSHELCAVSAHALQRDEHVSSLHGSRVVRDSGNRLRRDALHVSELHGRT
jgi:hypothetical protein